MKYAQSQASSRLAGFQGGQGFQRGVGGTGNARFGGRAGANGAGATVGEVVSVDGNSITVKLPDGSSKIVNLSDSTTYSKTASGTKSDVKTGERIAAFGSTNSDGSITAQSIQLNPMFRTGPRPTGSISPTQ